MLERYRRCGTIKYAVGRQGFDIKTLTKEIPKPTGNEVLVRVLTCGICGTDIHLLSKMKSYVPLGHEIAAEVVDLGEFVSRFEIGDPVVVEDCTLCGVCEFCKSGKSYLCQSMYTLKGQSGIGEYLLVPENMLHKHSIVNPIEASMVEPLAVSLNACLAAKVPPQGCVAVFGLGALGLMCIRILKHYGAREIICVGGKKSARNESRAKSALEMGADKVVFADSAEEVMGNDIRVDAIIVTSPPKSVPVALNIASYGAPIVILGVDLGEQSVVEIDIDRVIFNKNTIIPVFAEPANLFPLSISLIEEGIIDVQKLITHEISFEELDSLKAIYEEDEAVIKPVIKFS